MSNEKAQDIREILRFLTELEHQSGGGPYSVELHRLISGDALNDFPQGTLLSNSDGNGSNGIGIDHGSRLNDKAGQDGSSSKPDSSAALREQLSAVLSQNRQLLLLFVMRMREAQEREIIAERRGDKLAAQGWACRALAYSEVYDELKKVSFGGKQEFRTAVQLPQQPSRNLPA